METENSLKKCLVITGGDYPPRTVIDKYVNPDLVIAADSGLDTALKLGFECDYAIGDFDSVRPEVLESLPGEKRISYPQDKDYTDTELAVHLAREKGSDQIIIAGGGGGRVDHFLGILSLFDRDDSPDMWITNNSVVILIKKIYTEKGVRDKTFSFFTAGSETCTMESDGLKWPLDSLVWNRGDCGISNIAIKDEINIKIKSGKLLCIQHFEQE